MHRLVVVYKKLIYTKRLQNDTEFTQLCRKTTKIILPQGYRKSLETQGKQPKTKHLRRV